MINTTGLSICILSDLNWYQILLLLDLLTSLQSQEVIRYCLLFYLLISYFFCSFSSILFRFELTLKYFSNIFVSFYPQQFLEYFRFLSLFIQYQLLQIKINYNVTILYLNMQTPFARLRNTIDRIDLQYNTSHYLQPTVTNKISCKCKHSEQENKPIQQKLIYYTQEQYNKILNLYESQKANRIRDKQFSISQLSDLKQILGKQELQLEGQLLKIEKLSNQIAEKNLFIEKLTANIKIFEGRQKRSKQQNQRLTSILEELNKQINEIRSKNKLLEINLREADLGLNKAAQFQKTHTQKLNKQIGYLRQELEERKRILDFTIKSNLRLMEQKQGQKKQEIQQKIRLIYELNNKISQIQRQLKDMQKRNDEYNEKLRLLELKISTLNDDIKRKQQQIRAINEEIQICRNQLQNKNLKIIQLQEKCDNLEVMLEKERENQKYHIVEVIDQMKEKQLELAKGQLKQLIKQKIIMEERLKRACLCKSKIQSTRTTLYEQAHTEKSNQYLRVHEIRLKKKQAE